MRIVCNDGSYLTCSLIEITGGQLLADDYRFIGLDDVDHIENDYEDEEL